MEEYLEDKYIRFDWAIKRLLRQKANFGVLEGFLTVFLKEKVTIIEILESESNQQDANDKFNRVDIKARNSKDEIIIIEIQNTRELYYLERILYGVAKAITEHISLGEAYYHVKKIYSISVLYFDIGIGTDYLYYGQNSFIGLHTGDKLQVNVKEKNAIVTRLPADIFPEYVLIRVNEFDQVAVTPLEEWMRYLKSGVIRPDTTAPGLGEAREKLKYYSMASKERLAYDKHIETVMMQNAVIDSAKFEGLLEGRLEGRMEGRMEGLQQGREEGLEQGREQGLEKGREEERLSNARKMKNRGLDDTMIADITGLTPEEIAGL
ncbi:MAG: PD-(D/E)XK nuclease family transposase [Bacteroides sp.]